MASQGFSDTFLNQNAILGALIGKVGGSASDKPGPTSFSFVAGSFAVVVLDEKTEGALYLTMNDDPKQFPSHGGTVTVTIERARSR
jgi:hypothetical protein